MLILILPGMSGLELLLPRPRPYDQTYPVIMIAAYGDADTTRRELQGGAEAILTKPIDFLTLHNEIDMRVEQAA